MATPVRSVMLGLMLMWMMPSALICGVTLSTTPSVSDCGVTVDCTICPLCGSICVVVTKNTSCVPMRMTAGSLFIAVMRGLESTLTLPCAANAFSSAVKSPTLSASVKPPRRRRRERLRRRRVVGQAAEAPRAS